MRKLIIIALVCTLNTYGQTYDKFQVYTTTQTQQYHDELIEYSDHFETLFKKRDTAYLREQISKSTADKIYFIEGYNFETGKYSIFEEHINNNFEFKEWGKSEFWLDKVKQNFGPSYLVPDTIRLYNDHAMVDTIFPRKYRYGAGCVITNKTKRIFKRLRKKAQNDGIVIEYYCRVETEIDKVTGKISVKYCIPVKAKRECDLRAGMNSDYPESLDFWLFPSRHYVNN